jgi:hypothetical protein
VSFHCCFTYLHAYVDFIYLWLIVLCNALCSKIEKYWTGTLGKHEKMFQKCAACVYASLFSFPFLSASSCHGIAYFIVDTVSILHPSLCCGLVRRNLWTKRRMHLCMQDDQIGPKIIGLAPADTARLPPSITSTKPTLILPCFTRKLVCFALRCTFSL